MCVCAARNLVAGEEHSIKEQNKEAKRMRLLLLHVIAGNLQELDWCNLNTLRNVNDQKYLQTRNN